MFTIPCVALVTCHVSHLKCQLSHVTCQVSHFTYDIGNLFNFLLNNNQKRKEKKMQIHWINCGSFPPKKHCSMLPNHCVNNNKKKNNIWHLLIKKTVTNAVTLPFYWIQIIRLGVCPLPMQFSQGSKGGTRGTKPSPTVASIPWKMYHHYDWQSLPPKFFFHS